MSDKIPLSIPVLEGREWEFVKECLDTGWVSTVGDFVDRFERDLSEFTGASAAVATASGTAALHISLLAAGLMPEQEVIVPTVTFIAPVNAVNYCGAYPVFMDCDSRYCMDVSKLEQFLTEECEESSGGLRNKKSKRIVWGILPVHVFGLAVDLESVLKVASSYGLRVIEDAAEAVGSRYRGVSLGVRGNVGCLSFNGNKIMTTGGGGAILTDDQSIAERVYYLSTQAKDDANRYIHHEVGYNYRMTNLLAAVGVAQLKQVSSFIHRKRKSFAQYRELVSGSDNLYLPSYEVEDEDWNHWFFPLQLKGNLAEKKDRVVDYLKERGIEIRPLWGLNHLQKMYAHCQSYRIEKAFELSRNTLCLPCSACLTTSQIERVVETLKASA